MTFPKKPGYDSRRTFEARTVAGKSVLTDLLATAGCTDAELAEQVLKELYPQDEDTTCGLSEFDAYAGAAAELHQAESKIPDPARRHNTEAELVAQIVRLNTALLLYTKHSDDIDGPSPTVSKMTSARADLIYQLLQHSIAQLQAPHTHSERVVSAATTILWDNSSWDASSTSSEEPSPARKRYRSSAHSGRNLPEAAREVLQDWLEKHWHHPYPTEQEREQLAQECGIRPEQVNNWFINQRCRRWKPENEQALKQAVLLGNDDKIRELLEKADDQNPFKRFYKK